MYMIRKLRRNGCLIAWLLWLGCFPAAATAPADEPLSALEQQAMKAAVATVAPSVVRIETVGGLERVGETLIAAGPTTGVAVSSDGYVVSSEFNFVQMPSSILVTTPSGRRASAEIVARDHSRMMVLLKVNTDEPLVVPEAAPRSQWRVGQWTIAVGRAFDKEQVNLSVGILSAVDRIWGRALQTDAKISPSNYGGALIDIRGRVFGVLAPMSPRGDDAIAGTEWYDSGIGFAVAWEDILARLDALKAGQDQYPGVLGIVLEGSDIYADPAIVGNVRPASPAQQAGLRVGDEITAINGQPITRQAQMKHVLGRLYAGDRIQIQVQREQESLDLEATLIDKLIPYQHPFLGVLPRRDQPDGPLRVRYVYPDSPAAKAGMLPDDIVQSVGELKSPSAAQLRDGLTQWQPGDQVAVRWLHGEETKEADVKLTALPEAMPDDLPAALDMEAVAPDNPARTGSIELSLLEETNKCVAYVPESYAPNRGYGLLVWLHAPQKGDGKALIDAWKPACDQHNLILLAPLAAQADRWSPTEIEIIQKAIEQIRKDYPVASDRIVIGGEQAGAAIGQLTLFSAPNTFSAMVSIDAPLPRRGAPPDSDPLQRRAFYFGLPAASKVAEAIKASVQRLREMRHPVSVQEMAGDELSPDQRDRIARWIDSLDRI